MAREGITFEQVAAAADALVGEGQQPTIRAIRERLGTGSPNTVHKHLTAWREARPVAAAAAPELPQALTAAIAAEIERLRAALADAQQGRTAAEQQAAVLAAKLEACAERVARAEARVEQIEQQAAKAAQVHEDARAAAVQETRQAQAERDEARKVAAEAREQAARLAGQLEALTAKERNADERP
jgi:chromosome segregation ATPase